MPLAIGQVLENRYRIDALLGQGGMGAVYRATDLRFNCPVALKENLQTTQEAQRQFAREAGLLYQLRHPNLPRVIDHFVIPGQGQYLAMDYVEGEDLGRILGRQGPIPEAQALGWIWQVLDALEYLHRQNILHRDIKPANVKITPQGQVMLVDFGLAKVQDALLSTTVGARGVSPGFAPPEQYGMGRTDARTDLYSLGATLYALLTGQKPPDALELLTKQAHLAAPRQLNPRISPRVEAAILRAMQPAPSDRFQSAAELRTALGTPPPAEAKPAAPPRAVAQQRRRLPAWFWPALAGAAVLVVAIGVGAALLAGGGADRKTTITPELTGSAVAFVSSTPAPRSSDSVPSSTAPSSPGATQTAPPVLTAAATSTQAPTGGVSGGRIAFTSDRDGNEEIYVMNADGSGQTRLTNYLTGDHMPSWSPDGKRIAFTSDRDGNPEIYVMNADGSGQTNLTNSPNKDYSPAWSRDGKRIAFTSYRDGNEEIYAMNADGSGQVNLTNNPFDDRCLAYSPYGTRIAFVSNRDGNPEIYAMEADGSRQMRLTDNPAEDAAPAWSRDARHIAFQSDRDGNWEIYVMNADGSGLARLTNDPAGGIDPTWSPDGTRIAFASKPGNVQIYVMNADGSGLIRLTNNPFDDYEPAWSRQ